MKVIRSKDYKLIAKLNRYVHDLHVRLYPEYFKPYDQESFTAFYKELIDQDNLIFLVLEDLFEPVGFAMVELKQYPETIFKKAYQSVYVHQISISDKKQNKGYGTMLMEEIETLATQKEIHRIELDYWSNNEIAKSFYKKNKFTIYREHVYRDL